MEKKIESLKSKFLSAQAWSVSAGLIGIIVAIFAFYASSRQGDLTTDVVISGEGARRAQLNLLSAKIDLLQNNYNKLKNEVESATTQGKSIVASSDIKKLEASLKEVIVRQDKIEGIILQNPSKALEMPLLRRDIETIRESQAVIAINVKNDIDRVYDLNKWLLGAMAISIITLAMSNYLKGKE